MLNPLGSVFCTGLPANATYGFAVCVGLNSSNGIGSGEMNRRVCASYQRLRNMWRAPPSDKESEGDAAGAGRSNAPGKGMISTGTRRAGPSVISDSISGARASAQSVRYETLIILRDRI